ncbi:MAG: Ty1/Copia family ribonuclease HI [bacterium]
MRNDPRQAIDNRDVSFFEIKLDEATIRSTVFEDNAGALTLAYTPAMTLRNKHIGIKYHFFREHVQDGTVMIKKIATDDQKADMFTKGLAEPKFAKLRFLVQGW